MAFDGSSFLDVARALASDQEEEPFRRTAVSRAYYAAYWAARRYIRTIRGSPTSIWGHIALWKELRVLRPKGDPDWKSLQRIGDWGLKVMRRRKQADYEDDVPDLESLLEWQLDKCERLLAEIRTLRREPPTP